MNPEKTNLQKMKLVLTFKALLSILIWLLTKEIQIVLSKDNLNLLVVILNKLTSNQPPLPAKFLMKEYV
jgi:hypothetical protein